MDTSTSPATVYWRKADNSAWARCGYINSDGVFVLDRKGGVVSKTGAYTATQDDYMLLCDATSAAFTITLPSAATVKAGKEYVVKKTDSSANAITVDPDGSETIDGAAAYGINVQNDYILIVSDGVNWRIKGHNKFLTGHNTDGTHKAPIAKNKIINGDNLVRQEEITKSGITVTTKMDLWELGISNSGTWSLAYDDTSLPNDQSGGWFKATCTALDATVGAGDYVILTHKIEGYNYKSLYKKSQTVSFWAKSNKTGTYAVALRNSAAPDRSYVATFAIDAANTAEKKTVVLTAVPSGGTWNFTTGIGLSISITFVCGSTYQTSADAWQSGNYFGTSSNVNLADANNNYFSIAELQLEEGIYATAFERKTYQQEVDFVQRYYEKSYNMADAPGTVTEEGAESWETTAAVVENFHRVVFKQRKAATPAITVYSSGTGTAGQLTREGTGDVAAETIRVGEIGFCIYHVAANYAGVQLIAHWVADIRL